MPSSRDLVEQAKGEVEDLTPAEVAQEIERDALVVDVREPTETGAGVLPGAVMAPRGLLEFTADPASPQHREGFDPSRRVVVYCSAGGRSALAAKTLRELGYTDVAHLEGGFAAWTEDGRPTEPPPA